MGITYPLTDRPDGRPRASDRSAPRGISPGRRPIAWDRPDRTYTLKRTCTRQRPTERRDADRTGHHWDGARTHSHIADELPAARSMAYHRANAPTRPSAAPGRLRVPRARATQAAAGQADAGHQQGRLDGRDRRPRRKAVRAHRCSYSAAPSGYHYVGRANEPVDWSTTTGSRRRISL